MSDEYKDFKIAQGGDVIEVATLTEYEKLPIAPGRYWVIGQILDVGDRLHTGKYSAQIQVVSLTYYDEPVTVFSFSKKDLDKLMKSGHAKVVKKEK